MIATRRLSGALCALLLLSLAAPARAELYPSAELAGGLHLPAPPSDPRPRAEFNGFAPAPEHFPLRVVLSGPVPEALTRAQVLDALSAAARTWNQVPCAFASFEVDRSEAPGPEAPPAVQVAFAPGSGPNAGRIAWTTYPLRPDERAAVMLSTTAVTWRTTPDPFQLHALSERPAVDLQAALTHELGHVLGLSHTRAYKSATMAASYLRDGSQRRLSADDKLGLCELFATPGSECSREEDCPERAACVAGVCDKRRGQVGDYCAWDLMHCPDECHIDSEPTGTGYCTSPCEQEQEQACPPQFLCRQPEGYLAPFCRFEPAAADAPAGCAQAPGSPAVGWPITLAGLLWARRRRRLGRPATPSR
ncbi:hypothetical protein DL240_11730 [Lujinxingia litoralis]|uniref:Peptidase M10 metallopeptidase domain-containing protein n=1 Tax=Lujinxingia litoralis TaxID=2211119 RepID=A0A328C841_9DELT|nr:matrixin family metalloprotease [Lujinxingia litoralis]RAL21526.1 hypothetical protein DL240_11730 [Lujinxingia litoralis]